MITCRNPFLADQRGRRRVELLLAAAETLIAAAGAGRLVGSDKTGLRVVKLISRYKIAKRLQVTITDIPGLDPAAPTRSTIP